MNINYKDIRSQQSGETPWYEVDVTGGVVTIIDDKDGGLGYDMTDSFVTLPTDANSQHEIGVTNDGELVCGTSIGVVRAHLGWYYPSSNALTLLNFVE